MDRRSFLKLLGATALTPVLPALPELPKAGALYLNTTTGDVFVSQCLIRTQIWKKTIKEILLEDLETTNWEKILK